MEPHANEFVNSEYIIPEQNFAFTPYYSPSQPIYPPLNVNSIIEDKLTQEFGALLQPESKEFVLSKIDQYAEAGKAYINAYQFHNAQKIYELVVEVQPRNEKAVILLARCLQMNEEYHKAIFFMKYALELCEQIKNDPFIWFNIGHSFFKIENYTQAEQHFKHSLRVDPFFPLKTTIYLYLGIINKYNLQYKIAIEYFLMNLQDQQNQTADMSSLVLINVGQCLECFQEYDEAASCYNKSLCLSPNNFTALKAISWLFFQNGKISESKDVLMQALYINQDREIYYMQARCLEQLGKHKEAMKAINQAILQEPNNPDNFTILGIIFNKLNMHMESFQSFQRAYHLDTSKIENLFNMALIYEVAKKYPDALKLYSKLLLLDLQDCIVLQRKACIESSNYQNLTEFQMRYPSFKPSATLWIENQKQPKYNVLHEISTMFTNTGGVTTNGSNNGHHMQSNDHNGKDLHAMFDTAPKKGSILSLGGGSNNRKDTDDHKSSFHRTSTFIPNSHKSSINGNPFSIKHEYTPSSPFHQNGFARSRNNSFNLKVPMNHDESEQLNKNNVSDHSHLDQSSERKFKAEVTQGLANQSHPLESVGSFNGSMHNRKDSSLESMGQNKNSSKLHHGRSGPKQATFGGDNAGMHYENNDGQQSHMFQKKEEGEDNSFSNSPKNDRRNLRKESDLFYDQNRRNSVISNFGGGGNYSSHQHQANGSNAHNFTQFGYSPFNGPIAKDSIDFGYSLNNNYFGDQMDNHNLSHNQHTDTRQKKSSFLIAHNAYSGSKNGSKLPDGHLD